MAARRHLAELIACAVLLLSSARALAHCAPPEVAKIALDPAAPGTIELMMSFGNARSEDGGASWRLQCDEVYLPAGVVVGARNLLIAPSGRIALPHYSGLFTTSDRGCSYKRASGVPKDMYNNDPPVFDAALDPSDAEHHLWAAVADSVWESHDGGQTLTPLAAFDGHQVTRVLASATEPRALFAQSFVANPKGGAEFFVSWTDDPTPGGAWTTATLPDSALVIRAAFVDPFDAHRLYVVAGRTDQTLYAVTAAPAAFKTTPVFSVQNAAIAPEDRELWPVAGVAPGELWVGVRGDDMVAGAAELHHSTDGGGTWQKVPGVHPHFRCLENLDGQLWACGNNIVAAGDAFAAGSSDDGGRTWTRRFAMGDLCEAMPCLGAACHKVFEAACTPGLCMPRPPEPDGDDAGAEGGVEAPADAPDQAPEATVDAAPDAGALAEPPGAGRGGCGCGLGAAPVATPVGATAASGLAVGLLLVGLCRRRPFSGRLLL